MKPQEHRAAKCEPSMSGHEFHRLDTVLGHKAATHIYSPATPHLLQDPTAKGIHRGNYTTRSGQTNQCIIKPESEWYLHEVEALVSVEVWDECNKLIDDSYSKQKRPAKKAVHIFSGIAIVSADKSCMCLPIAQNIFVVVVTTKSASTIWTVFLRGTKKLFRITTRHS
jgi:hypothetical protein